MHMGAPSTRAFMPVMSSNGECTHAHMTAVDAAAIDLTVYSCPESPVLPDGYLMPESSTHRL